MADTWLPTLQTDTPQAGFELAVKLSRMGVKMTQPSDEVRTQLRSAYDHDSVQLIASSQVIAINFQTVSAANNWWRSATA
jgi:hexameric tyrosine-coordinated heme protein (HTHP)